MRHVGGGKHVGFGAAGDFVLEQARGPVFAVDLVSRLRLVGLGDIGQRGAQAAGGIERNGVGGR